jgi:F0F1-type ATP synthase membrane subunit b/b'
MDQQAKSIKDSITRDVNADIASIKSDIDKEYEKAIKDIVKK